MIRFVLLLLLLAALAFGASWIADRPGEISMVWQGWTIETTVPVALSVIAAVTFVMLVLWRLLSFLLNTPQLISSFSSRRRREKGWNALTRGLLAVGVGDGTTLQKARAEAVRLLPNEPLTQLLSAQAAQFEGRSDVAMAAFQSMAERPETRLLGLRGLHMEARRSGDMRAAYAIAEEAANAAPALGWAADAVIEARCAEGDFSGAREVLERQMAQKGIDKVQYRRRRAVLLAAEAQALEPYDPLVARERAVEAVRLAPTLVPAAASAGRLLGAAGELRKAAKVVETAYAANPHPELADVEAFLRPGDAVQDRLKRIRSLAGKAPDHPESAIALARAAIDAHHFLEARRALEPLLEEPTQRVCLLMAELEAAEHSDIGKAREWTARAVRAGRDPAWIADGVVSDHWAPISPVTGKLDAFVWAVPPGVSSTPILEHEADRVVAAIAAARESEERKARELAAAPPPLIAEPAEADPSAEKPASGSAPAPAESPPVPPAEAAAAPGAGDAGAALPKPAAPAPADPPPARAEVVELPTSERAASLRRPPAAQPITALPPLPDDPGPEGEPEPEAPTPGKTRPRILGL